jgi:predicted small lipoprotein YifL
LKTLATLLLAASLTGCAAKSATRFSKEDVAKVHIDPRTCKTIPQSGDLTCKCRVVLATVPAKELAK